LSLYLPLPPAVLQCPQPTSNPRSYCSRVCLLTAVVSTEAGRRMVLVCPPYSLLLPLWRSALPTVCGSSSRSDDVPPSHTNDPRLTGSSAHAPQGSGLLPPIDTRNPTLISYSKPPERSLISSISLRPPITDQPSYNYQTPRTPLPSGEPLHPGEWPGGFQADYDETWANNQVTDTQTTTDATGYYQSTQSSPGDSSAGGSHHHPTSPSSPYYSAPTQVDTSVQPIGFQSYGAQYSTGRRISYSQGHSPTSQQPANYHSLLTTSQSGPSYSHPPPTPLSVDLQWSLLHAQSNRSVSDSTPVTYSHNYADSQPPIYPTVVVSSGNLGQAPNPSSLPQPPSSLGGAPPYQSSPPYPPADSPSFSVPQPARQTRAKGKKAARSHPYPESGRKIGKKVSPLGEQPMASSSRITSVPPPQTARGGKCKEQSQVSVPNQEVLIVVD